MGLGRCEWYEALAIIWFGCGYWIAFDWRYEFTVSKFLLCLACLFVGSIRSANCCSADDLGKTFITSINPTNKKGIVELEGYGLDKSFNAYSSKTSEVYLGKLDDVYLNDYFKSFGCIGEFTPIQLLKSSNREPSLKDIYRAEIDSLLCNTIGPAKGIIKGITTGDKSGISSKDRIQMSNA